MRQPLSKFIEVIKKDDLIGQFPEHDIYLWSNFGFNETEDIDLKFVGNVTSELGERVWELYCKYRKLLETPLDPTLYTSTKLFEHIPRFNKCTEDLYYFDEDIHRYKVWEHKNNEFHGREVEKVSERLYKVKQIFARKDGKYTNRHWTYPILLSDLIKL